MAWVHCAFSLAFAAAVGGFEGLTSMSVRRGIHRVRKSLGILYVHPWVNAAITTKTARRKSRYCSASPTQTHPVVESFMGPPGRAINFSRRRLKNQMERPSRFDLAMPHGRPRARQARASAQGIGHGLRNKRPV